MCVIFGLFNVWKITSGEMIAWFHTVVWIIIDIFDPKVNREIRDISQEVCEAMEEITY